MSRANTAFIQKIMDYATDTDVPDEEYFKLMEIAEAHIPIAQENMARKAIQMMAQQGVGPDQLGGPRQLNSCTALEMPLRQLQIPHGTQSQSQQLTPELAV